MSGPHSPNQGVGADGPQEAASPPASYPGLLPPPVGYPQAARRRRRWLIPLVVIAAVLVAGLIAAMVRGTHHASTTAGAFSDTTAKTAIQDYLDALEHRDIETISRNTLCGIYDAVRDRRSDQALAKLSSDAFRKQFTDAHVTSIDKIVYWSTYQAQVLFSMRVSSATGGGTRDQVQGIAQLLNQHGQVLVCSYVLRTAGTY